MCRDSLKSSLSNVAVNWIPEDGQRSVRRPQTTWRLTFGEDLQGMGVTWRGGKIVASDQLCTEMEESHRPRF